MGLRIVKSQVPLNEQPAENSETLLSKLQEEMIQAVSKRLVKNAEPNNSSHQTFLERMEDVRKNIKDAQAANQIAEQAVEQFHENKLEGISKEKLNQKLALMLLGP